MQVNTLVSTLVAFILSILSLGRRHCGLWAMCFVVLGLAVETKLLAADDVAMTAELEQSTANVGDQIQLILTINKGPDEDPVIPTVDGIEVHSTGTSSRINISNGTMSREITYSFVIIPTREGVFNIPSIEAKVDGKTVKTLPLVLRVGNSGSGSGNGVTPNQNQQSAPKDQQSAGRTNLVFVERVFVDENGQPMTLESKKATAYEGQALSTRVRIFHRTNINLVPERESSPDWRVMTHNEKKQYEEIREGVTYRVLELQEILIPLKSGQLKVPAFSAQITYVEPIPQSQRPRSVWDLFQNQLQQFGREVTKRFTTRGRSTFEELTVSSLPPSIGVKNPVDAVGTFRANLEGAKTQLELGNTLTLTLTLEGEGALDRIQDLTVLPQSNSVPFKIYPDKPQLTEGIENDLLKSKKIFRFAIVPEQQGSLNLEPFYLSYFDLKSKGWKELKVDIPQINVSPSSQQASQQTSQNYTATQDLGANSIENSQKGMSDGTLQEQKRPLEASLPSSKIPDLMPENSDSKTPTIATVYDIANLLLRVLVVFVFAALAIVLWISLRPTTSFAKEQLPREAIKMLRKVIHRYENGQIDIKVAGQEIRAALAKGHIDASVLVSSEVISELQQRNVEAKMSATIKGILDESDRITFRTLEHV